VIKPVILEYLLSTKLIRRSLGRYNKTIASMKTELIPNASLQSDLFNIDRKRLCTPLDELKKDIAPTKLDRVISYAPVHKLLRL
jgi:hypothetical protein